MPDPQTVAAQTFLDQKVRETITKCGVAGLAAVLVTKSGDRTMSSAHGTRKLGATGAAAKVQPNDRWCLGSVSKPVTGTTIGVLIQKEVGKLTWKTKMKEVFPEAVTQVGAWPQYQDVTLAQLMAHTSGMGWNPVGEPLSGTNAAGGGWFPVPESLGLNDANVMERRRRFVRTAVLDAPLFAPGTGAQYGGGAIICAAMFEARTGVRFERLVKEHVYAPLGMANSGWGMTSPGALDGPWHHRWDKSTLRMVPDDVTHSAPYDFNSHGVVGNLTTSAGDMGRFIKEHLRTDPQVMTTATRAGVQSTLPAFPASNTTQGAWFCGDPVNPSTADIWHNGDDGTSYSYVGLKRSAHWGCGLFTNVNSLMGGPATNDLLNTMVTMMGNWDAMFSSATPLWEAAHPGPGLTAPPPRGTWARRQWLFTRKHTGALVRRDVLGANGPQAPIEFPGVVLTSGIAAASSLDGKVLHVMGRGTDNRIWRVTSEDGGVSWPAAEPIPGMTFATGPAVAVSEGGGLIHVFAVAADTRMYRTRSISDGEWSAWEAIGSGSFTSQPAAACSHDGRLVHAFARGNDHRIWTNVGHHSGATWDEHWAPIHAQLCLSGPAATCDPAGSNVHVTARGTDTALWHTLKPAGSDSWQRWKAIPAGTFSSSPDMTLASTGALDVVALGGDWVPYTSRSTDAGTTWGPWVRIGSEFYV